MNIYDEALEIEREFWQNEPTRRLSRVTPRERRHSPELAPEPAPQSRSQVRRPIDPLIARLGAVVAIGLLALPATMSLDGEVAQAAARHSTCAAGTYTWPGGKLTVSAPMR